MMRKKERKKRKKRGPTVDRIRQGSSVRFITIKKIATVSEKEIQNISRKKSMGKIESTLQHAPICRIGNCEDVRGHLMTFFALV